MPTSVLARSASPRKTSTCMALRRLASAAPGRGKGAPDAVAEQHLAQHLGVLPGGRRRDGGEQAEVLGVAVRASRRLDLRGAGENAHRAISDSKVTTSSAPMMLSTGS